MYDGFGAVSFKFPSVGESWVANTHVRGQTGVDVDVATAPDKPHSRTPPPQKLRNPPSHHLVYAPSRMQPIEPKVRRDRHFTTLDEKVVRAQVRQVFRLVCRTCIGQVLDAVGTVLRDQRVRGCERGLHLREESVRVEEGDGDFGVAGAEVDDQGGHVRVEIVDGAFDACTVSGADTGPYAAFAGEVGHYFHGRSVHEEEIASAVGIEGVELFLVYPKDLVREGGVIRLAKDGLVVVDAEEEEEEARVAMPFGPRGVTGFTSTGGCVPWVESLLDLFDQVIAGFATGGRAGDLGAGICEVVGQDFGGVEGVSQVHDEVRTVGIRWTMSRWRVKRVPPGKGRIGQTIGAREKSGACVRCAAAYDVSASSNVIDEHKMGGMDLQDEKPLNTRPFPIGPAL